MATTQRPPAGGDNVDRLARAAAMVTDAVALLNQAIDEFMHDRGHGDTDERDAARPPERDPEQPR